MRIGIVAVGLLLFIVGLAAFQSGSCRTSLAWCGWAAGILLVTGHSPLIFPLVNPISNPFDLFEGGIVGMTIGFGLMAWGLKSKNSPTK
jgi:hypothetical protein